MNVKVTLAVHFQIGDHVTCRRTAGTIERDLVRAIVKVARAHPEAMLAWTSELDLDPMIDIIVMPANTPEDVLADIAALDAAPAQSPEPDQDPSLLATSPSLGEPE